jgi:hypothetical protein
VIAGIAVSLAALSVYPPTAGAIGALTQMNDGIYLLILLAFGLVAFFRSASVGQDKRELLRRRLKAYQPKTTPPR